MSNPGWRKDQSRFSKLSILDINLLGWKGVAKLQYLIFSKLFKNRHWFRSYFNDIEIAK